MAGARQGDNGVKGATKEKGHHAKWMPDLWKADSNLRKYDQINGVMRQ